MSRIWNKHKQFHPVRDSKYSNGAGTPLKPHSKRSALQRGRRKVFVGMSGGVDSSVAALLLQKQGWDVVGVYLKSWDGLASSTGKLFQDQCTWKADRQDALRVAAKLRIPFRTYDLREDYRREVIEYFFREYEAGRTPNPDVMCNRHIKFKGFLDRALNEGADFIATGHYVRRLERQGRHQLHEATDSDKDQSYFLWTLDQWQLEHSLFPIGDLRKREVRALAAANGLVTATKKDSQGICFVGPVAMEDFLRVRITERDGAVVTSSGQQVGAHKGTAFFTIGQRHGLRIPSKLPYYVCSKDMENNIVYVSEGNSDPALYRSLVRVTNCSWIADPPVPGEMYQAKIRYRQRSQDVILEELRGSEARFRFLADQRAVTPGQSLVLYRQHVMIGGAVISGE